jgi:Tfp pilus assembly protein PilN
MRAVNLIPAEHRAGTSVGAGRSEGAAYVLLALVAGLALLAFLYGRADKQISSGRAQTATLSAQAQRAQSQAAQLAPYTTFVAMREQRAKAVADLVDSRFDWAHVFHEFGRVLPLSVSVTSLSGTVASTTDPAGSAAPAPAAPAAGATSASAAPGPAAASAPTVTSATPPGSVPSFNLSGCATSQPAVAQMLTRLRLIDGVANVTLQSSTKASSSGGGGAGGCGPGQPTFSASVTFDPLPTSAATQSAIAVASAVSTRPSTVVPGGAR